MEIRDQITFVVAQRTFADEVSTYTTRRRPLEGDLIFMPMTDAVYQIQYVNEKAIFYQMGALQTYDLTCELFEYSSQIFNTGYPSIDDKYNALSIISSNYHILDTTGSFVITGTGGERIIYTDYNIDTIDVQAQNEEMETEADLFLDFSESNPFGEHV